MCSVLATTAMEWKERNIFVSLYLRQTKWVTTYNARIVSTTVRLNNVITRSTIYSIGSAPSSSRRSHDDTTTPLYSFTPISILVLILPCDPSHLRTTHRAHCVSVNAEHTRTYESIGIPKSRGWILCTCLCDWNWIEFVFFFKLNTKLKIAIHGNGEEKTSTCCQEIAKTRIHA